MARQSGRQHPDLLVLVIFLAGAVGLTLIAFCRPPPPGPSFEPTPTAPPATMTVKPGPTPTAVPALTPTATLVPTPNPVPDPVADTAGIYKPAAALRASGCQYQHAQDGAIMQDPTCTTGATDPRLPATVLCASGFTTKPYRDGPLAMPGPVTEQVRLATFAAYGVTDHNGLTYEVDHLIPLEVGGSNDPVNLWPQPAQPAPGFHEKDLVENWVKTQVCAQPEHLADLQKGLATDWTQYLPTARLASGIMPKRHDSVTGDELD